MLRASVKNSHLNQLNLEIGKKTKTLAQHSTGGFSQNNKARKRNKMVSGKERKDSVTHLSR